MLGVQKGMPDSFIYKSDVSDEGKNHRTPRRKRKELSEGIKAEINKKKNAASGASSLDGMKIVLNTAMAVQQRVTLEQDVRRRVEVERNPKG